MNYNMKGVPERTEKIAWMLVCCNIRSFQLPCKIADLFRRWIHETVLAWQKVRRDTVGSYLAPYERQSSHKSFGQTESTEEETISILCIWILIQ